MNELLFPGKIKMVQKYLKKSFFVVVFLCSTGCHSLLCRGDSPPRIYPAVRMDAEMFKILVTEVESPYLAPFAYTGALAYTAIALSGDIVCDTLALPYDIYQVNKDITDPVEINKNLWKLYERHYKDLLVTFKVPLGSRGEETIYSDENPAKPGFSHLLLDCKYDLKTGVAAYEIGASLHHSDRPYKAYKILLKGHPTKSPNTINEILVDGKKAYQVLTYFDKEKKDLRFEHFYIFIKKHDVLKLTTMYHHAKAIYKDPEKAIALRRKITQSILRELKIRRP